MRQKTETGYENSLVARVLLTSDYHRLSVPVGKQKGQALKLYEKFFEGIINIWKHWNMKYAIPRMIQKISQMTVQGAYKFNFHIIGGDLIECQYNERGMTSDVDCEALRDVINSIPSGVAAENTYVIPGDHELGYRLPLSSDSKGGVSVSSFSNYMFVVGPFWQKFSVGGKHFLLLSSSLMLQKLDHLPAEQQREIEELRREQKNFIMNTLADIPDGERVFVFVHDPDAIVKFNEYVGKYWQKINFTIFCGHMHAEWSLQAYKKMGEIANLRYARIFPSKILQWAKDNVSRMELFKKYDLRVVPAPGGMMGFGGGFLVLDLYDDKTFEVKKHRV